MAFRRDHSVLRADVFYTPDDIHWHGPNGAPPDWNDSRVKMLGCHILGDGATSPALYLMFNAEATSASFVLPQLSDGHRWCRAVDTALRTPDDLVDPGDEVILDRQAAYEVQSRSSVILIARNT